MYHDRLSDSSALFGSGGVPDQPAPVLPVPPDDRDKLAQAVVHGMLASKCQGEFLPAVRAAGVAAIAFYKCAAKVKTIRDEFAAVGVPFKLPSILLCTAAELAALSRAMIAANLVDVGDPVLMGIDLEAK